MLASQLTFSYAVQSALVIRPGMYISRGAYCMWRTHLVYCAGVAAVDYPLFWESSDLYRLGMSIAGLSRPDAAEHLDGCNLRSSFFC